MAAPLSRLCCPDVAARLRQPRSLGGEILLRSYRPEEWPLWFAMAGVMGPTIRGPIFDNPVTMAEAAAQGNGVALVPVGMFRHQIEDGRLVRPFATEVAAGSYWLTWLKSKALTPGMSAFRDWLLATLRTATPRV